MSARWDFDTTIVHQVAHRPWSKPASPWVMTQTWSDLLFAHWPIEAHALRRDVPAPFELDLFDGRGWIGVVPFRMTNVGPRGLPAIPGIAEFAELNVRTYVRVDDRPGVYFFSLDAESGWAVRVARALLNLPYHLASMTVATRDGRVRYDSRRAAGVDGEFRATYEPTGEPFVARPGTLEYFLTERYCLYHTRRGRPYRLEIHHPPWRLQHARARLEHNTMAAVNGLTLPEHDALLHFSKRQDVVAWAPITLDLGPR